MPIVRGNPGVKAGKVEIFAFNDVDPAWIDCDGRALNVVDEPALFAAIGYTWGGAGAVFNVPNMVDDFVRGAGPGRPVGTREGAADSAAIQFETAQEPSNQQALGVETIPENGDWSGWRPTGRSPDGTDIFLRMRNEPVTDPRPRNVAAKFRIKR